MSKQINILCLGDSNTFGRKPFSDPNQIDRYDRDVRWPARMQVELGEKYHVIEEGLPGRTTVLSDPFEGAYKSCLYALPTILESHRPLDCIVVMLGTNDCKACFNLSAKEIANGMRQVLEKIQSSGTGHGGSAPAILLIAPATIFVRGVMKDFMIGADTRSQGLSSEYKVLATRMGTNFFDASTIASADTVDGIHLNEESHVGLAKAVSKEITTFSRAIPDIDSSQ